MRGTSIGRFLVLDRLGEGGMGVVYAAYDPELDRKIAIKLLRSHLGASADFRARLLREAQAMARLSHANVVSVYDVGTFEEKVFVAMEFIDGRTLGAWLKEKPRSWCEILDVCRRAGAGLAAAHAAGLVHRDFKPGNVLVRRDEVVKVSDFGLALSHSSAATQPEESEDAAAPSPLKRLVKSTAPQSSPVVGTPGYMAPEQLRGDPVDARADQYSFCVTLYEALLGERPFEGETRATAQSGPKFSPPRAQRQKLELPTDAKLPPWVLRPLLRGLSPNPRDRYPTLDELLAALGAEPRSKWRRAFAIGAVASVLAGGVVAYRAAAQRHNLICKGAEAKLAGIWDAPRQEAIQQAFLATAMPFAQDALIGTRAALNAHTHDWVAMHTDACEATRLRREQSEALLDLRMDCLRRRLDEVRALSDLFARADALVVEHAVEAAQALPKLGACGDAEALLARVRPPEDPKVRARVDALRARLNEASVRKQAGKYNEALPLAQAAAAESLVLGYQPVRAEALELLGDLQDRLGNAEASEQTLYDSLWAAEGSRHDEVAFKAWADLMWVAVARARYTEAERLGKHADAALSRLGGDPVLRAQLLQYRGYLFERKARYAEAHAVEEDALALAEKALGPAHPHVARLLQNLGGVEFGMGRYEDALQRYRRSLALEEAALGAEHPDVAIARSNLANVHQMRGHYGEAVAEYKRALDIKERSLGPEHASVASTLSNLGEALLAQGETAQAHEALAHYQRAVAIKEKAVGPQHPLVASSLSGLGATLLRLGRDAEALSVQKRAFAIREKSLGVDHPQLGESHLRLGLVLRAVGRGREAMEHFQRALVIARKAVGADHPDAADALAALADCQRDRGQLQASAESGQRSLAIREQALGAHHPLVASALEGLGNTVLAMGDRARAAGLFERALALRPPSSDNRLIAEYGLAVALRPSDARRAREVWDEVTAWAARAPHGPEPATAVDWLARHRAR